MTNPLIHIDTLLPPEVARRAEKVGAAKAALDAISVFALAVLGGAFISVGGIFFTTIAAGADNLPYDVIRMLTGLTFWLSLILVVATGTELFTANTLVVIAWTSGKVNTLALLRYWILVYTGNLAGSGTTAVFMFLTRQYTFGGGAVGQLALVVANDKVNLDFGQGLALGMICSTLVCLTIWLTFGARTTTDKLRLLGSSRRNPYMRRYAMRVQLPDTSITTLIPKTPKVLAIFFLIAVFAAATFEYSVANMYFISIGLLIKQFDEVFVSKLSLDLSHLTFVGLVNGLIPVTIGNIIGGGVLVAVMYRLVYLRYHGQG